MSLTTSQYSQHLVQIGIRKRAMVKAFIQGLGAHGEFEAAYNLPACSK